MDEKDRKDWSFTKRIAYHPWTPRIAVTLLALCLVGMALLDVCTIRASEAEGGELGFEKCLQVQLAEQQGLVPLRSQVPSAQLATDEALSVSWPHPLPGDLDGDCKVTVIDIMLVAKEWGNECINPSPK